MAIEKKEIKFMVAKGVAVQIGKPSKAAAYKKDFEERCQKYEQAHTVQTSPEMNLGTVEQTEPSVPSPEPEKAF